MRRYSLSDYKVPEALVFFGGWTCVFPKMCIWSVKIWGIFLLENVEKPQLLWKIITLKVERMEPGKRMKIWKWCFPNGISAPIVTVTTRRVSYIFVGGSLNKTFICHRFWKGFRIPMANLITALSKQRCCLKTHTFFDLFLEKQDTLRHTSKYYRSYIWLKWLNKLFQDMSACFL